MMMLDTGKCSIVFTVSAYLGCTRRVNKCVKSPVGHQRVSNIYSIYNIYTVSTAASLRNISRCRCAGRAAHAHCAARLAK